MFRLFVFSHDSINVESDQSFHIKPPDYFGFSFLVPDNALFDIMEFYRSSAGPVAVFKRMKDLKDSEYIDLKCVNDWLLAMEKSTKNIRCELQVFFHSDY